MLQLDLANQLLVQDYLEQNIMATQLPSHTLKRTTNAHSASHFSNQFHRTQVRHASLLKRPHRPYTFTQLVTLSDGSTYTARTTSPAPVYKSTKDSRNHPLWQPSLDSLRNVEQDEAGRLRAFRQRFGRGWDIEAAESEETSEDGKVAEDTSREQEDSLMDLISGASARAGAAFGNAAPVADVKSVPTPPAQKEGRKGK